MEELQKAILNVIITEPKRRSAIFRELDERYFSDKYKTIFSVCKQRYINKQEIDSIIISTELDKRYFPIITDIISDSSYYAAFNEYISKLKESYSRTQALRETEKLLFDISDKPLSQLRNNYIEISKLFDKSIKKQESIGMKQGLVDAFERLGHKKNYYKTGYNKLDKHLLISRGDYIVIGGRPSAGKTTFALNVMLKMSKEYRISFFTFETSSEKVYDKILSISGGVKFNNILNSDLLETDYSKILNGIEKHQNNKFEVVEAAGMNVEDIRNISIEKQADIIFIDYLGLIDKRGMGNNIYEQITNISNSLHNMSQSEKITIIALVQLNRMAENKEPTMADIRDSGAIEQDADAIIFLHNPPGQDSDDVDIRLLKLSKNKLGSTGDINYKFYKTIQTFHEM